MSMLSIVIPIYNEAGTLIELLRRIEAVRLIHGIQKEIVIVDDGSTDGTRELLESLRGKSGYTIILHEHNQGKGMAIRTALPHTKGDYIIIQDADLEYDPEDYNLLLAKIIEENVSVVYGSRQLQHKTRGHSGFSFYMGALFLTFLTNVLYRQRLTDEPTCYKLFKSTLLKSLPLRCKRFEFCPEVTALVANQGIEIKEVPISYAPRRKSEGKKIGWRDGWDAVCVLIAYKLKK